ncbi:MAG: hypothetical protein ABIG61_14430 [Planctomycetota bacterium]
MSRPGRNAGAEAFWYLLKALDSVHYYVGRNDQFPTLTYYYFQNIHKELERFSWILNYKSALKRIEKGQTVLLFSDDIPRRDNEGIVLEKLLGLKLQGTKLIPSEDRPLYRWKPDARADKIWYDGVEILLSRYGKGWIAYCSAEEINPEIVKWPAPMPRMKIQQKDMLCSLFAELGMEDTARPKMSNFEKIKGPLYWHGPLYNSGNCLETVRFYKLLPVDHFGWAIG